MDGRDLLDVFAITRLQATYGDIVGEPAGSGRSSKRSPAGLLAAPRPPGRHASSSTTGRHGHPARAHRRQHRAVRVLPLHHAQPGGDGRRRRRLPPAAVSYIRELRQERADAHRWTRRRSACTGTTTGRSTGGGGSPAGATFDAGPNARGWRWLDHGRVRGTTDRIASVLWFRRAPPRQRPGPPSPRGRCGQPLVRRTRCSRRPQPGVARCRSGTTRCGPHRVCWQGHLRARSSRVAAAACHARWDVLRAEPPLLERAQREPGSSAARFGGLPGELEPDDLAFAGGLGAPPRSAMASTM